MSEPMSRHWLRPEPAGQVMMTAAFEAVKKQQQQADNIEEEQAVIFRVAARQPAILHLAVFF